MMKNTMVHMTAQLFIGCQMYDAIVIEMAREPRSVVDNGRRVWRCLSITLLSSCEWAALPGTQETVLGNPGSSRERKEAVVSMTREKEFSYVFCTE